MAAAAAPPAAATACEPAGPQGRADHRDRYRIEDRLGSGGMSSVFRATDTILERTVAVKILAEHLSDDERFVARFRREALAVAKLVHPNIVQVYDTGNDERRHYIVMEYVQGRSGAQLLQATGRARRRETAVEIGVQACAGLDYAHRHGIIHRDVKPGNLMIIGGPAGGGDMTVKLADFGIARASRADPDHPGRLGRRHRRLPVARAGARRGGDPGLRRLRARRRPLPVPHRPAALRGRLAGRAGGAPAVRAAAAPLAPTTTRFPRASATPCCARSKATRRAASPRAGELADALRRGLRRRVALPPTEAPTRVLPGDDPTAATRHLRTAAQTEYRPAASPDRRPAPRAPLPPPPAPAAARKHSRNAGLIARFVRFVMVLAAARPHRRRRSRQR